MLNVIAKTEQTIEAKEKENAKEKLTSANLDVLYKLTGTICSIHCMRNGNIDSAADVIQKYSNGRYDHNIDTLYDAYMSAKQAYQSSADQQHKDKLMDALGRLMVEVYDMIMAMINDSDFQDEKKEIMRRIRMITD